MLTSAKAKKFQDGDRSIRLYTTISLQLRRFLKIATIIYQKDSPSFQQWVQKEAKRSILQDYEVTDTHTQTTVHVSNIKGFHSACIKHQRVIHALSAMYHIYIPVGSFEVWLHHDIYIYIYYIYNINVLLIFLSCKVKC